MTEPGDWVHSGSPNREGPAFETIHADEIGRLAQGCFAALAGLLSEPAKLMDMRRAGESGEIVQLAQGECLLGSALSTRRRKQGRMAG